MTVSDGTELPEPDSDRFSVREFARTAQGSHRSSIDLDELAATQLSAGTLRVIRQLGDLERGTMGHLRNVLVTATHKDARVTAFLVSWAYEKFWIADALDAVLAAGLAAAHETGQESNDPQRDDGPDGRRRHDAREAADRRGPIRRAISAMTIGEPIIAVHATSGLVDEWVTRASYLTLTEAHSRPLNAVIERILSIKARHSAFFEQEAQRRLAESTRAVRLTRRALLSTAWPVGSSERSAADRSFLEQFTFGGDRGRDRAAAIASRVASLPGMDDQLARAFAERLAP